MILPSLIVFTIFLLAIGVWYVNSILNDKPAPKNKERTKTSEDKQKDLLQTYSAKLTGLKKVDADHTREKVTNVYLLIYSQESSSPAHALPLLTLLQQSALTHPDKLICILDTSTGQEFSQQTIDKPLPKNLKILTADYPDSLRDFSISLKPKKIITLTPDIDSLPALLTLFE
jgi:uncharacterized protein with FMN-binding domain